MDILDPELIWVEGRCYRIPVLDPYFSRSQFGGNKDADLEEEVDSIVESETMDEENIEMPPIKAESNGKWKMVFPIARAFLPFIIGVKGSTVKRIANNTSCSILTPRFHEQQNITIYGPKKEKVILAWKSILNITKSSRKRLAPTHFISIPLTASDIKSNFLSFKAKVLSMSNLKGICEELFQDPNKLHLTILVCTLMDNNERNLAETLFHNLCEKFVRPLLENRRPCILEVEGLDYMNDDPSEVKTLFANAKINGEDGLLQELCDEINLTFQSSGLMKEEPVQVKVHVTLMNTSYLQGRSKSAEEDNEARSNHKGSPKTFDATDVIRLFHGYYFGQQELRSIHLSTRFTVDENGYYKYLAKMDL